MPGQVRASLTRLAALCALVFGILAMHHVTTGTLGAAGPAVSAHHPAEQAAPGPSAAADDAPAPAHGRDHAGFHMCLAILLAAALLAVTAWLLLRTARGGPARPRRPSARAGGVGRAPPFARTTSVFLSSLCILRV
ncbi:DUF6153 family protein [Rhodococcus sp. SGAir0479]|uniref:DUF6153 family protein n=1 Tax=Rhodococcus sp. SGAir0479 TaxID=2567884 RepID=UPI0010CD1B7A|nr:DUF6153 family protein [Rhodococcus sp. SGAir0479]QCQ90344.1 hypothetical protein E7742_03330 [Rhodococcus sp. SGAir0479]